MDISSLLGIVHAWYFNMEYNLWQIKAQIAQDHVPINKDHLSIAKTILL